MIIIRGSHTVVEVSRYTSSSSHLSYLSENTFSLPEQRVIPVGLPCAGLNLEWFFGAWPITPFKDYWYFKKGIREGRYGSIDMPTQENSLITVDCPIRSKSIVSLLCCLGCWRLRMAWSRKPRGSWCVFS